MIIDRHRALAAFVLTAIVAWSPAVSSQEEVFIEIDAKPIPPPAPAPRTEAADGAESSSRQVVVAPIADATGMFPVISDRALLDSALRTAIAERPDASYAVVELPPALEPCDRACEVERARVNGAQYLIVGEIRLFAGAYVAIVEIVRISDGKTVRTLQTDAVADPPALLAALRITADQAGAALVDLTGGAKAGAVAGPAKTGARPVAQAADGGWVDPGPSRGHGRGATGNLDDYRARRGAGIFFFVLGLGTNIAGGVVAGAVDFWVGIGIAAAGNLIWIPGLVAMTVNSQRIHKIERGEPLSKLRLRGLSPIVASSQDRAAPGLSASFSF